jgi:hypothetical protein
MSGEITINNDSTAFTRYLDASAYESVTVKCTGLGAAESVAVNVQTGGSWVPVGSFDPSGATNNIVLFTGSGGTPASVRQAVLEGDHYQFVASGDPAGTVILTARLGSKRR